MLALIKIKRLLADIYNSSIHWRSIPLATGRYMLSWTER